MISKTFPSSSSSYLSKYIKRIRMLRNTVTKNIPRSFRKSHFSPLPLYIVATSASSTKSGIKLFSRIRLKNASRESLKSFPATPSLNISFIRPFGSLALSFLRPLIAFSRCCKFQGWLLVFLKALISTQKVPSLIF